MTDVLITFGFGVLGYYMRKYGYGLAPMVLAMILGPLCEASFQRAMIITNNDFFGMVTRPLSGAMLAFSVISLCYPWIRQLIQRLRKGGQKGDGLNSINEARF